MCLLCRILIFSNSLPFSLVMHGLPYCQKCLSHRRTPPHKVTVLPPPPTCAEAILLPTQRCRPAACRAATSLPTALPPPRCCRLCQAAAAAATLPLLPLPSPRCHRLRRCAAVVLLLLLPPPRCCRRHCRHSLRIHHCHRRCHRRRCRCRFLS